MERSHPINWRDAVLGALRRYSNRHNTRVITRQSLIEEELATIAQRTASEGITPEQTLSRVLQNLRDEGLLHFTDPGLYVLLDTPVRAESEDLPVDAIDYAIDHKKLILGDVLASDAQSVARHRRGQERVRRLTLYNYETQCAFCDITDEQFLVASHVSRWGDDPEARGILSNVICMCRIHDALFENGLFSLADDYSVIRRGNIEGEIILRVLDLSSSFRHPVAHPPLPRYLMKHRQRVGLQEVGNGG